MRSIQGFLVFATLLLICFNLPIGAQTITGTISGDVTDASGAVVAGATVTVVSLGTNQERSATTNSSGNFDVPNLAIGKYKVTAAAAGFKTSVEAAEGLTRGRTRNAVQMHG